MTGYVSKEKVEKGKHKFFRRRTYQSNFELTSKEKVDSIGVIASSAVCWHIKQNNKYVACVFLIYQVFLKFIT